MKYFVRKLKRYAHIMYKDFQKDLCFSKKLALYRAADNFFYLVRLKKASLLFHEKKEQCILSYLSKTISKTIDKHKQNTEIGQQGEVDNIWVCWWTGIETAPKIVQQCVKSIKGNSNNHSVHILTEKNIDEYIQIPKYMLEKVRDRKMGLAHLADYIRVCLLNKYGGLWLDATIFCADSVPEWFYSLPFFTCKSEYTESRYLSKYQWTTFCLGGWKGNIVYSFIKDAFEAYWKTNDYAIDYLLFDYIIYLAKENNNAIRALMEAVPVNTPHRDDLQAAFNEALPAQAFESIIQEDTPIYKLSWRETYSETTVDGEESIYGYFLNMNTDSVAQLNGQFKEK